MVKKSKTKKKKTIKKRIPAVKGAKTRTRGGDKVEVVLPTKTKIISRDKPSTRRELLELRSQVEKLKSIRPQRRNVEVPDMSKFGGYTNIITGFGIPDKNESVDKKLKAMEDRLRNEIRIENNAVRQNENTAQTDRPRQDDRTALLKKRTQERRPQEIFKDVQEVEPVEEQELPSTSRKTTDTKIRDPSVLEQSKRRARQNRDLNRHYRASILDDKRKAKDTEIILERRDSARERKNIASSIINDLVSESVDLSEEQKRDKEERQSILRRQAVVKQQAEEEQEARERVAQLPSPPTISERVEELQEGQEDITQTTQQLIQALEEEDEQQFSDVREIEPPTRPIPQPPQKSTRGTKTLEDPQSFIELNRIRQTEPSTPMSDRARKIAKERQERAEGRKKNIASEIVSQSIDRAFETAQTKVDEEEQRKKEQRRKERLEEDERMRKLQGQQRIARDRKRRNEIRQSVEDVEGFVGGIVDRSIAERESELTGIPRRSGQGRRALDKEEIVFDFLNRTGLQRPPENLVDAIENKEEAEKRKNEIINDLFKRGFNGRYFDFNIRQFNKITNIDAEQRLLRELDGRIRESRLSDIRGMRDEVMDKVKELIKLKQTIKKSQNTIANLRRQTTPRLPPRRVAFELEEAPPVRERVQRIEDIIKEREE